SNAGRTGDGVEQLPGGDQLPASDRPPACHGHRYISWPHRCYLRPRRCGGMSWLLIFVGGLLGSAHCVGLGGGFVLPLCTPRTSLAVSLSRQLAYGLGRIFTYAAGGAAAGFGGWRLSVQARSLVNIQATLALAAGVLLVSLGLVELGVLPRWRRAGGGS